MCMKCKKNFTLTDQGECQAEILNCIYKFHDTTSCSLCIDKCYWSDLGQECVKNI